MERQPHLPSGVVTFLFTDIEGSTRLVRRLGDRYSDLLDRHLALLDRALADHDGHLVDTAGDGIFAVFHDAGSALSACSQAQRLISSEAWPADGEIRVRMGLHTGLAVPHQGEYRALVVHQAARVMSAAHGGQVLLTEAVVERLPPLEGESVAAKGRFRVRDFENPVQLFELTGPDLPRGFPAIRAVPAEGHNLISPPTTFRGRDEEMQKVAAMLGPGQMVTLLGTGGVGKTRLAVEIGLSIVDRWPDGVWMIDLAPVEDPALIPTAIANDVGVPSRGGDRWDEVVDHLRDKQALLLLDNCDLIVAACGLATEKLLTACPDLAILATSREPLGIKREQVWRVDPLEVPPPDATPEELATAPAIQLFLDRVASVRPQLGLEATVTVAEICRQLDGLPLALELAGARMGLLSPPEALDGLRHRFRLLRTKDPALPERQRTLEASLEWSERMLAEPERSCLRRLGVFGSSFTLTAASACVQGDDIDEFDVPELVWSLVDKSLIVADLTANETRYRMMESVKDFARYRLIQHGECESVARSLAKWFLERLGPWMRDNTGWSGEVAVELDNLRALIPLLAPGEAEVAQQVAFSIGHHLDAVHAYRDGIGELTRLTAELTAPTRTRVSMLTALGDLHLRVGDTASAENLVEQAEALAEVVGGPPSWDDVAIVRTRCDLASRAGDHLGAVNRARGAMTAELGARGQARMHSQIGIGCLSLGDLDGAAAAFRAELELYRSLGNQPFQASALGNLAEVELRRGLSAQAAAHQRECLQLALSLGAPALVGFSVIVAARLAAAELDWETAVRLHARADVALEDVGLVLYEDDRRQSEAMLDQARAQLGDDVVIAALSEGRALSLWDAIEAADRVLQRVEGGSVSH